MPKIEVRLKCASNMPQGQERLRRLAFHPNIYLLSQLYGFQNFSKVFSTFQTTSDELILHYSRVSRFKGTIASIKTNKICCSSRKVSKWISQYLTFPSSTKNLRFIGLTVSKIFANKASELSSFWFKGAVAKFKGQQGDTFKSKKLPAV